MRKTSIYGHANSEYGSLFHNIGQGGSELFVFLSFHCKHSLTDPERDRRDVEKVI